jgi:hypothetical protein
MFNELALHDATLASVLFNWAEGCCTIRLEVAGKVDYDLKLNEVPEILIPRREPLGLAISINAARTLSANIYEIELQSVDVIRVSANQWEFISPRVDLSHKLSNV